MAPTSTHRAEGLRFGPFTFESAEPALYRDGSEVPLAPKPLAVLSVLLETPGAVVSKEKLTSRVWNGVSVSDHSLTEAIRQLREALGDDPRQPHYIQTVHRRGYRFVGQLSDGAEAKESSARPRRWLWGTAGAALGAVGAVVFLTGPSNWSPSPAVDFRQRDFVLVTHFENDTVDSNLDGLVDFSVEWELGNSPLVSVAPRERVNDILRLMKKPDTLIDAELGREICLRDGEIRALVTGRIQEIDGIYLLRAKVMAPQSGSTVAAFERQAPDRRAILPATRALARDIRASLGEHLEGERAEAVELPKVTTDSLSALRFFSRGARAIKVEALDEPDRVMANRRAAEAFTRAVEEDADFATAHIYLAHAYSNLSPHGTGMNELAAPHYRRAFELADTVPDRERYFILGSYYQRFTEEWDKALVAYENLLALHPDDYWTLNNAGHISSRLHRYEEWASYVARRAALVPHRFRRQYVAARAASVFLEDYDGAAVFFENARRAYSPEFEDRPGAAFLRTFEATRHWVEGDARAALEALRSQPKLTRTESRNDDIPQRVGAVLVTLGRLDDAERTFERIRTPGLRHSAMALVALARGDESRFRQEWLGATRRLEELGSLAYAGYFGHIFTAGEIGTSDPDVTSDWARHDHPLRGSIITRDHYKRIARGEDALRRKDASGAIALLEEPVRFLREWGVSAYFLGAESLSKAYETLGDRESSRRVIEEAGSMHPARAHPFTGFFWLRARHRQARMYRERGRVEDAEAIEDELRQLLQLADEDHVIRKVL